MKDNRMEAMVCLLTGKIIMLVGCGGATITAVFDKIAGRVGEGATIGFMQTAGIIVFIAIGLFGTYADSYLNETIKPMIEDAYGKL